MTRTFKLVALLFLLLSAFWFGSSRLLGLDAPTGQGEWRWQLPVYVPPPRIPPDNTMSEAKFELGRYLFYDARLSGNGTISCASCHQQAKAFADSIPKTLGATGEPTHVNVPGLANAAWHSTYTWANPAIVTLERQMPIPLFGEHPIEMGVTDRNRDAVLGRIRAEARYGDLFSRAFGEGTRGINLDKAIKAVATFQRGILSFDSRYDRYLQGKEQLSPSETRGMNLFFGEKAECHHCHGGSNFNDQFTHANTRVVDTPFHNTALYNVNGKGAYPGPNRGLIDVTGKPEDMGRFRAPSLRNVAVTGPYAHDGSVATLEEMLDIYAAGGRTISTGPTAGDGRLNPFKSELIGQIALDSQDRTDIVAFLKTLTDQSLLTSTRYANPWVSPLGSPGRMSH